MLMVTVMVMVTVTVTVRMMVAVMMVMVIMNDPSGPCCSVHSILDMHSFHWSLKESCVKGKPTVGSTSSL